MILINCIRCQILNKCPSIYGRLLSSNTVSQPNPESEKIESTGERFNKTQTIEYSSEDYFPLDPTPIKSLNVLQRIEKIEKHGSIFKNLFLGQVDTDLLSFPFLLKSRKEFVQMTEQYEMIRKTWNKMKKNEETLNLLKYDSLYELSVSEMMFIFEAIGASIQKNLPFGTKEDVEHRFEKRLTKTFDVEKKNSRLDIGESAMKNFDNIRQVIQTVIPLIEQNAIVYFALNRSLNENVKQLLKQKPKIAFAYDEDHPNKMDIRINQWSSEALITHDFKSWIINGHKNRIMDRDYDYYLLFNKTNTFPETQPSKKSDNDVGIVGLLVPSHQLTIEHDFSDYFAIDHQKIKFDHLELNRDSSEVVNASKDISEYSNIKGCGQLAVSSVILGLLKQLQKNTYAYLVNNRIGLTDCELIQYKLFQSTCKIYALESVIYLTAAMYDSFEHGTNLGGESILAKTIATEYAYDIIGELRSLFGSRYPFSSIVYDLIYYLDSFLDSSMHNRMYAGYEAVEHFKTFEEMTLNRTRFILKGPIKSIKHYLQQRKLRNYETILSKEISNYIHHNMHAACDWTEHCLNLLQFSMHLLTTLYKEKIYEKHLDLNRVVTMAMDINIMIACLSRANHSLCYGFQNNHTEKEICMAICKDLFLKQLQIFEMIDKRVIADNDEYARNIFETNLLAKGYFPQLFQVK